MEVLISIAAKIAEYTVAPIGRQVGYVLFYKGNLKELNEALKELEVARESIKHLVDAEIRNGKEIEAVVQDWLKSVDGIIEEAKQLREDRQHANAGCSKWSFPDLKSRHQLSRKAKKMVKLVADVNQKRNFDSIAYLPALQVIRPSTAIRSNERFESRHLVMMQIMRALADSKLSKIGVYGLGGVGKTTLMKEVAAKVSDDKLFDAVVMAFVTKSPDITRIQDEIADQLGLQFGEKSSFGRACRLLDRIKREKSILIILDDLCSRLDLEEVGIPFQDAQEYLKRKMKSIHPGCKLLLTSRNREVLQEMETEEDFRLDILNQTETWNLFVDMVGDAIKDPSLRSIAIELAKKCNGLPVLIATIARAVKNKGIHEWKEATKKLERVDGTETYMALEFCYNSLGSNEVKALFLLCGVVGPSVSVKDLMKYAMGLGILTNITTMEDAREKFNKMICALQASCLLLEGDTTERVKMHDIVHEAAISIACRDQHAYIAKEGSKSFEWPTENFPERCSMIISKECPIHVLPKRLDFPKIKFFHIQSDNRFLEIPTSFFEGMGNLKVLDLTAMNLLSLPISFVSLTNLQTLCLDDCALEDMTSIGALKNLEILSLMDSSLTKFPSEIAQLVNLKMLDLSNSGIEVIPPNIISKLTKLEELYMGNTSIKWEHENSANQHKNASLTELMQLPKLIALDLQIPDPRMLPGDLMFVRLERYKIFIGDGWKWSGKYESSKTLKLKVHTSIHHLEHGIKLLLRKAEDLHLDELSGISNVLFQLNAEGFPHLKNLYIQNNAEIKHIIDSIDWIASQQCFPKLEILTLQNLHNLEKICHGQPMFNSFRNLKEIKVKSCDRLRYLLSYSMAIQIPQLQELEVSECKSMKILLVENDTSVDRGIIEFYQLRSLALQTLPMLDEFYSNELESPMTVKTCKLSTTCFQRPLFSKKVAFSNLETLKLSSINLGKIWEDNQVSSTIFVQNLTYLTIEDCGAIKYLFSFSKVSNFSKLKLLEISKCHMMEEIMVSEEESSKNIFSEVQFLKLEKLIINDMQNLKTIWNPQFTASSFGELKTLEVRSCPKLVNIFPSYMQRKFRKLETLTVSDCDTMEEIFQLDANDTTSDDDRTELKNLALCKLPKLKQIWSGEPKHILVFHNLQSVHMEACWDLQYLFPFSVAANLHLLERIFLDHCNLMYIVEKKDDQMGGTAIFVLDSLTSLCFWRLHNLKGFYAGNHILSCSSLKRIYVSHCDKLKIFNTMSASQRYPDDRVYECPLFTIEEVIPNLEELTLNHGNANMIMQCQRSRPLFNNLKILRVSMFENEEVSFPYWFLQHMPILETIFVENCSFREIFHDEKLVDGEGEIKSCSQLKCLTLWYLPQLQHICKDGFNIDPVLKVVEKLYVYSCSSLKILLPSNAIFTHLIYLKVERCHGLINLFTSSVVRSLVKLEVMMIKECNSIEEIVTEKGDEAREEIIFGALKILKLVCLPKLNRFCSSKCPLKFKLLETLAVMQCPRMHTFSKGSTSVVKLRKVQIEENDDGCYWKGDLDQTIRKMFMEKVAFQSFQHFRLAEYPELKELWFGKLPHKIFRSLKSLVVQGCNFLTDSLFQLNLIQVLQHLEELEVRDCDLLEAVFDMEVKDDKEMQEKEISQLKKLMLSSLPRLMHVWKKNPKETLSFQNLCEVCVDKCESLECLFPLSVVKELIKLEKLEILSCGIDIIVADERVEETVEFVFPLVSSIKFWYLKNLKSLYPGKHTSKWPSLKKVDIYDCKKLRVFAPALPISQEIEEEDVLDVQCQQPLFFIEKVIPNLECLALNYKDAMLIREGQYQENFFHNIKTLALQCFYEQSTTLVCSFLQRFANVEKLELSDSSYEMIFPWEGFSDQNAGMNIQIRQLRLEYLSQLKCIWSKDSCSMDSFVGDLQALEVLNCSSLKTLVPPSICFENLTNMYVGDCRGLIYLITSSTAKSLVQLRKLRIVNCSALEHVICTDEEEEAEEKISFESLEFLQLTSLSQLKSFSLGKHMSIFPSLVVLNISGCPKMDMFSPGILMTPILKAVTIEEGKKHWKDGLNSTITQLFQEKVAFQSFQRFRLAEYPELKELWFGKLPHRIFRSLKSLVVQGCNFLTDSLFQVNLIQVLQHLEELEVRDCDLLEAVFDMEVIDDKEMQDKKISQLKKLTLSSLPRLMRVWKKDPKETLSFQNLCEVCVHKCESLECLFPFFIVIELIKLEKLEILSCGIDVIVANEGVEETVEFVFPLVSSIKFWYLKNLKSLYPGKHTSKWPSLKKVDIYDCKKLRVFAPVLPISQEREEEDVLDLQCQQPLLIIEKVILSLEFLALNYKDAMMIWEGQCQEKLLHNVTNLALQCFYDQSPTLLGSFLQRFLNLEELELSDSSYEIIFPWEGVSDRTTGMNVQIRRLRLELLGQLKYIWSNVSHMDPLDGNLESLEVVNCCSLKNLVPPSICLENLTNMYVDGCQGLNYLITSSTAKSLVQLKTMAIVNCKALEHIICTDEEEEAEEEITFKSLESLVLTSLSHLKKFCSGKHTLIFPSLEGLDISSCPRMNMFSPGVLVTPMLNSVTVEEKKHWRDGLNSTIKQLFQEKVAFHGFKLLELSEYPELKELWYGSYSQGGHHIFSNLKSIRVRKCDFLSDVLLSSNLLQALYNLEELEVTACASLGAIIDVKGVNGKDLQMKEISQLKKLKLSGLPNLKQIWNKKTFGIISFRNMLMLHVVDCEKLESMFSVSVSKDLAQLEELNIQSCGLVEIFSKEDGLEECRFDLPQLTKLRLWNLTKLKCFYPERHILDCPSLNNLTVYHCGALQTFSFEHSGFKQAYGISKIDFPIPQALFPFEKVCSKVKRLPLNSNSVMRIRSGHYQENLFHEIDELCLQCFHETQADFPIDFLHRFPNLGILIVRCSSFETLFPLEGVDHHMIAELFLYKLERLKYIWDKDLQSPVLVPTLDTPPSSISFKNLTNLHVNDCKELMYLLTSSVAKSLLQLKSIYIKNCESMVDVVKNDEVAAEDIITFKKLEELTLTSLSSLRSLFSGKQTLIFPSLVELEVTGCPKMKTFSSGIVISPFLQSVTVEDERKHWKGDLNTTIQQLFKGKMIEDSKES